MLEERPLGDPNEALASEPSETQEIVEDVVYACLVEGVVVDEDRKVDASDGEGGRVLPDGGIEEGEEEGIEDSAPNCQGIPKKLGWQLTGGRI